MGRAPESGDLMKKHILGALTIIATVGGAEAADLTRGPAPYYSAPAVYNWAGFYAGINAGYEWGKITNLGLNPNGFAGGIQAGYNWQTGGFVFGGETDIQV